jgi:putative ABC transport system permease protein
MENLLADIRLALRSLRINPGFTFVAVAALTIGIGATTGIFSVVDKVLLQPLPYANPDSLVQIGPKLPGAPVNVNSIPKYTVWRNNNAFSSMALYNPEAQGLSLSGNPPRQIMGLHVSLDFFRVFDASPMRGRTFLPVEDQPNGPRCALISENLWRTHFGSDPKILDTAITLNSETYAVIGVIPSTFVSPVDLVSPAHTDVWIPLQADLNTTSQAHYLALAARLKPGVSIGQSQAEMHTLGERFRRLYPRAMEKEETVAVNPMRDAVVGDIRKALYVLTAAVAFVLLIACANVASLLVARASARQREIAIRAAIGASRWRIVRQLLTESILLSMLGGVLGLMLGGLGVRSLLLLVPGDVPRLGGAAQLGNPFALVDWRVFAFTMCVSLLTGIVFGLLPALQISNPNLASTLKAAGNRSSTSRHQNFTRKALVALEMALALVLLTSAALLVRTFVGLSTLQSGIDSHHVLTILTTLSGPPYRTTEDLNRFAKDALQRIETIPGVEAASSSIFLPTTSDEAELDVDIPGRTLPGSKDHSGTEQWRSVTPHYFQVFRIPLERGRAFSERDTAAAVPVVIVNARFVQKYFPNENPMGKRIEIARGFGADFEEAPREIVGVVGDVRETGLAAGKVPVVYVPLSQQQQGITKLLTSHGSLAWAIRANRDEKSLTLAVAREIQGGDSQLPLAQIRPMDKVLHDSLSRQNFNMLLLSIFAGSALLLAAIGIYGLISYAVQQQEQEIGIRMAMGADKPAVFCFVMRQAIPPTLIGAAVGLAAAFGLTRLMESLLYGVKATDPLSFFGVAAILILVSVVSILIPVGRALSIDATTALRSS